MKQFLWCLGAGARAMALGVALAAGLAGGVHKLAAQAPARVPVPEHVVESDRDFLRGGSEPSEMTEPTAQPTPEAQAPSSPGPASKKRGTPKSRKAPAKLPPAPPPTNTRQTGPTSASLPVEEDSERVRAFLADYLQAGQTSDLKRQTAFFSERVDYFSHGVVDRAFIRQDTLAYNTRWPVRSYQLRPDIELRPTGQPGVAQVNFTLTFNVRSDEKSARGITFNTALLRNEKGRLKIASLKERLLNRKR